MVFIFNISNSVQDYSFVCTQLNRSNGLSNSLGLNVTPDFSHWPTLQFPLFGKKWVYIIVSLISKLGNLINGFLLKLNQRSSPQIKSSVINSIESCSLLSQRWILESDTQQGGGFPPLPCFGHCTLLSAEGGSLQSFDPYIGSRKLLTSKIKSKISISQSLIVSHKSACTLLTILWP